MPMKPTPVSAVLLCECSISDAMPGGQLQAVKNVLTEANAAVLYVDDLCGAVEACHSDQGSSPLQEALNKHLSGVNDLILVACAERAVRSLLTWSPLRERLPKIHFLNLRDQQCVEELRKLVSASAFEASCPQRVTLKGEWIPWFPVIDREACIDCGKCFEFCLFGVYSREEEKVDVANPQNCKNNCPACARVCPAKAIIFPKFPQAPINGESDPEEPAEASGPSILRARKAARKKLFSRRFEKKIRKTDT